MINIMNGNNEEDIEEGYLYGLKIYISGEIRNDSLINEGMKAGKSVMR